MSSKYKKPARVPISAIEAGNDDIFEEYARNTANKFVQLTEADSERVEPDFSMELEEIF
jgi:hypothetical protein